MATLSPLARVPTDSDVDEIVDSILEVALPALRLLGPAVPARQIAEFIDASLTSYVEGKAQALDAFGITDQDYRQAIEEFAAYVMVRLLERLGRFGYDVASLIEQAPATPSLGEMIFPRVIGGDIPEGASKGWVFRATKLMALAKVGGGSVHSASIHKAYGHVSLVNPLLPGGLILAIKHRDEFLTLWELFEDEGFSDLTRF
jgi:hypothetical protein